MSGPAGSLLHDDEPPACRVENASGKSAFLILCDHASNRIPRRLNSLGLPVDELQRHIAWDIGAAEVSSALAQMLDATLILQGYSRLVIDCNRPLHAADSIATLSERTTIPGNLSLSPEDVERRQQCIFALYHAHIRCELDARRQRGQATVLLAMHSFTPVYLGQRRPWHIGLLFNRDPRLALALSAALRAEPGLVVGENEPYSVGDDTDYSIPEYGERCGLPHVEIEIRQDLITDAAGQRQWAERLARLLPVVAQPLLPTA